jgi:hypothetical protein
MQHKRLYERIRPGGRIAGVAKLFLNSKAPAIDCILVDYSPGGACIQLTKHLDLPPRFELLYGTSRKRCHVVWKRALRVGLAF